MYMDIRETGKNNIRTILGEKRKPMLESGGGVPQKGNTKVTVRLFQVLLTHSLSPFRPEGLFGPKSDVL